MSLSDGPLLFLTDGSADSLAALPQLASFAAALGCRSQVLHLSDGDDIVPRRTADAAMLEVLPLARRDLLVGLKQVVMAEDGILVVRPRHRSIRSLVFDDDSYERLLRSGIPALLTLPARDQPAALRRVLFPLDLAPRSDVVLEEAISLCVTLGAKGAPVELHFLHVFGDDRRLPSEVDRASRAATTSPAELLRIDQQHIESMVWRAHERGLRTVSQTAEGRAHTEIVRYVAEHEIDLVVMASHGPRQIEDVLLGSTTVRVVQRALVPVLAVRTVDAQHSP